MQAEFCARIVILIAIARLGLGGSISTEYASIDDSYGPFPGDNPTNEPLPDLITSIPQSEIPVVELSIFLNNVESINGQSGKWVGDIFLTYRFKVNDFAGSPKLEIINGKVLEVNEVHSAPPKDAMKIVTQRLVAEMVFDGNYNIFPFESQQLILQIAVQGFDANQVRLRKLLGVADGIHPPSEATGRHFKAAQFRVSSWNLKIGNKMSYGMPYLKSLATMTIVMQRYFPYYCMSCVVLPMMATIFAMSAFQLPVSPIMPRVMISFVAFLAMFVHFKSLMSLVPPGVWCWLFTEMSFFMALLSMAILMNICSAVIAVKNQEQSERLDRVLRWGLPITFFVGLVLLLVFKTYHVWIGAVMIPGLIAYFTISGFLSYRKALFNQGPEPHSFLWYCLCDCCPCCEPDEKHLQLETEESEDLGENLI